MCTLVLFLKSSVHRTQFNDMQTDCYLHELASLDQERYCMCGYSYFSKNKQGPTYTLHLTIAQGSDKRGLLYA